MATSGQNRRIAEIIDSTLAKARRSGALPKRHPAEVTIDRLGNSLERWADAFTPEEKDAASIVIDRLQAIADGEPRRGH